MNNPFSNVVTDIAPADEMYSTALRAFKNPGLARALYLRQGMEISDAVQRLLDWRFGGRLGTVRLLDFACGFGRSTRFLVNVLPPANIWVSDICRDAVDFQKRIFGVNGFYSVTDPGDLTCGEAFDMIFVSSLFSHLPERRFAPWVHRLFDLAAPKGILAFSVHDEAVAGGQDVSTAGLLFNPTSESTTLSPEEYGLAYVTESFVARVISGVAGPGWPYKRLVRGLCGAQDLYIVSRDSSEHFETLRYTCPPIGYVEHFNISPRLELKIDGWAGDPNDGSQLDWVEVKLKDRIIMKSRPTLRSKYVARAFGDQRFAYSGWACVHQLGPEDLEDREAMVEVRAMSSSGLSTILHWSPLSSADSK